MDSLKTPVTIPNEFAEQATISNINDIPQVATGSNLASWNEGFPEITRLTPDEGGLPPKQQDFNGIYKAISSHSVFSQNGGGYTFNQDVSNKIGGYPKGALLWYLPDDGSFPYQVYSTKNNNIDNFVNTPSFIGNSWLNTSYARQDLSNTGQLTNCVLSTGVNIQLEYDETTLTLKAGSKLIKPDGTWLSMTADATDSISPFSDGIYVYLAISPIGIGARNTLQITSGATVPSDSTPYSFYYNYTDKGIYYKATESTWVKSTRNTIPFAQVIVKDGKIADVVKLDTCSYLGGCAFSLPLTGLAAFGTNEDGTYKTVKFTSTGMRIRTDSGTVPASTITITTEGSMSLHFATFDKTTGYLVSNGTQRTDGRLLLGSFENNGTVITSMNPVHPIRLADANVIEQELQTKANIDLSNTTPSQAFKDMSIGWGMPDYNKPVKTTPGDSYTFTASYDCLLVVIAFEDVAAILAKITNTAGENIDINGASNVTNGVDTYATAKAFVKKGVSVEVTLTGEAKWQIVYPLGD